MAEIEELEQELEGEPGVPLEGDLPDDDDGDQEDAEARAAETFEPDPATETAMRLQHAALDREARRHEKALEKAYGPEWDSRVMCPLCEAEGFLTGWQAGAMPDEQWNAVYALAGQYKPPELIEDSSYQRCEHCDGWGETLSGAQRDDKRTKLCDVCSGNGYVARPPQLPKIDMAQWSTPAPAQPAPTFNMNGTPDRWGRPEGHPHYGMDPALVR